MTALILVCLAALLPSTARAQLYTETQVINAAPSTDEGFGLDVAASGDTLVVGVRAQREPALTPAYVFVRGTGGWVQQQKLMVQGGDVVMDGDTLVAGGIIHVRSGNTWIEQQRIGAEHIDTALHGDTLVVGLPYNRTQEYGAVQVWVRSGGTWTEEAYFMPGFPSPEMVGQNVALDGHTFIAGTGSSRAPGRAYIYVRDGTTWTEQAVLPVTAAGPVDVDIKGDTAVVGDEVNSRVVIFTRTGTTWSQSQVVAGPGPRFGFTLALEGDILAVGASGACHFYAKTASGWVLAQTIARPGFATSDVELANNGKLFTFGDAAAVGPEFSRGAVEVFSVPPPPAPGSGWRDFDVGAVGIAGGSTVSGDQVQVRGSGADIWERADQFHYLTESMTGDGAIIARVNSAGSGHPWAKVGLMFREDLAPASRNIMALVAAGGPVGMQVRASTADTTSFTSGPWLGAPLWLMLAREGNLFASYRSNDGETWTPIGSATLDLPATLHVGLAVSSHDNAAINTGTFTGIELVGSAEPPPPNAPSNLTGSLTGGTTVQLAWTDNSGDETGFRIERSTGTGSGSFADVGGTGANVATFTDAGLAANTTYTYRVKAVRDGSASAFANLFTITTTNPPPATLTGTDIGTATPGAFSQSGGVLTVDAAGADIWNQADEGYFVHRELTGNFDLRARVASLDTNVHPWTKAGVMVRESLDPRSRNLFTMVSASAAAGFQVRDPYGANTSFTEGRWVTTPYWVRLTRSGDTFQSYISQDGATWQLVATRTIALAATLRAGVAVSSHHHVFRVRATFTHLQFGP